MIPTADKWVKSLLRNNLGLEINATASEIWEIVGDPIKIFSNCCGINKVEAKVDDFDNYTQYTISYESEDGGADIVAHSRMVWYEVNQGWASLDHEPHPMGFEESMILVTIEQIDDNRSILNWDMYYNIENYEVLQMFIASLDHTLKNEISELFIQKFGARVI